MIPWPDETPKAPKPTLVRITHELQEIYQEIADQGGLITTDQESRLAVLLMDSEEKVTGYVHMLERMEQEQMYVKMKIKEAKEYCERLENTQKHLENAAMKAMEMSKLPKLVGKLGHWIGTRKSKSVRIVNPDLLLPEYMRIKTTQEPDKIKIKEHLENGHVVVGCELVETKNVSWR